MQTIQWQRCLLMGNSRWQRWFVTGKCSDRTEALLLSLVKFLESCQLSLVSSLAEQ
ncbi:MAG: hypothetical protein HC890_07570 [Chloroflexaceae bacterium]|nr:hypothetical protein [Chloroflexaceae bacterium]